jgi:ABC-type glycerol-3-phosphate transport system permease component
MTASELADPGQLMAPSLARRRVRGSTRTQYVAMLVLAALWLLPVVLMVSTSLKTQDQLFRPTQIIPSPIAWGNYLAVFTDRFPFGRYLANSMFVSFATVIGDVLSSAFIAYGFALLRFPGRRFLFTVMMSTMMFPFAVRMIPLFLLFKNMGWINTYYPLIVPSYFGTYAFFVFLLHEFFKGIPTSLIEAARVDGANELRIWWNIVLPLSKPALAVVALLSFEQSWNEFLPPLLYLNDTDKYTLPLGIFNMVGADDVAHNWNLVMAASMVMVLPVITIFFFTQQFFAKGVALSGLKG